MRGSPLSVAGTLIAILLAPACLHAGGIPAKTLKELKSAAVYVKVEFVPAVGQGKPLPATGSGFLFLVTGNVGYIATNNHVVNPPAGEILSGPVKVVFNGGMPSERTVDAQVIARDTVRDLAILKITGIKELPRPIVVDTEIEAAETTPVFALGFPFGGALGFGKKNPSLTITKGTISSIRYDDCGQVKLLQIDAEINPGNSGGPIVNEKGQLIGVAVPGPKEHEVAADGLKLPGVLNAFDPIDIVNGKAGRARCKVFAVKMKGGQKYQIDMTSNQFDSFLRVEDGRGRELAFDDDSGGDLNAKLIFNAPADGVYRIIAAQFDNRFGAFQVSVRPIP